MKILLTGAFGNVGFNTLQELIRQGQTVRCFDLKTEKTEKKARQIAGKAEIIWGDIRQPEDLAAAVEDQEIIIHLAFIIPPAVDLDPTRAYAVNVEGTRNVIEAAQKQEQPPKLFFASTFDVFGHTQDQEPPRKVSDPVQPTDDYTRHKVLCEELVQQSGLEWAIFRFCDVPPVGEGPAKPQPIMFTIPLKNRFEMVHPQDVAFAVARGVLNPIWGKIWLIGGGKSCQIRYEDYLQTMMERMGLGRLPEQAFNTEPYCTDWVDSSESQALLQYQRHSFEEILRDLAATSNPGPFAHFLLSIFRPIVRRSILKMSPYYKQA